MRVVLIDPPSASRFTRHWNRFPLLGLAYIASSLRTAGHIPLVVDGKLDALSERAVADRTVALKPDLVGITAMTIEVEVAARLARAVKSRVKTLVVVGGAHVNAVRAQALEEFDAFDFGCVGEGENLLPELAQAIQAGGEPSQITGLIHRRNGLVVTNAPRPYLQSYDALPFPAWDLFSVGKQIPVLTHRGCPFRCIFCAHNSGIQPRHRSPANVLDELEYVIERFKPQTIRFEDETFGLDRRRTEQILHGIVDRRLCSLVSFSAQTRADTLDEPFLDLLRRAGFRLLEIGVESAADSVLASKGITRDQVSRAVQLTRDAGIETWCKFILGHPHETLGTLNETSRFISELNPERVSVAVMTPYPGTRIREMAFRGEGGYRLLSSRWRDLDKYTASSLELEHVGAGTLKLFQIWCYLRLYLGNRRAGELVRLVLAHAGLAAMLLFSTVAAVLASFRRTPNDGPGARSEARREV